MVNFFLFGSKRGSHLLRCRPHHFRRRLHPLSRRLHLQGRRLHLQGRRLHLHGRRLHLHGCRLHLHGCRLHVPADTLHRQLKIEARYVSPRLRHLLQNSDARRIHFLSLLIGRLWRACLLLDNCVSIQFTRFQRVLQVLHLLFHFEDRRLREFKGCRSSHCWSDGNGCNSTWG